MTITIDGLKNLTNLTSINLVANGNESFTLEALDTLPNLERVYVKPDQRLLKQARYASKLNSHKCKLYIQDVFD